ncbi:hypothetical protein, partial [Mesorhizobium sp.]|uniref:hypothetical protein n=1 Tax=Mesorhizobium sp. TaxID=1871066 RepID=UPI0025BB4AA9
MRGRLQTLITGKETLSALGRRIGNILPRDDQRHAVEWTMQFLQASEIHLSAAENEEQSGRYWLDTCLSAFHPPTLGVEMFDFVNPHDGPV